MISCVRTTETAKNKALGQKKEFQRNKNKEWLTSIQPSTSVECGFREGCVDSANVDMGDIKETCLFREQGVVCKDFGHTSTGRAPDVFQGNAGMKTVQSLGGTHLVHRGNAKAYLEHERRLYLL